MKIVFCTCKNKQISNFFYLIMVFSFVFHDLSKTPIEETGCLSNSDFFTGCSSIQFFDLPNLPFQTQSVRPHLINSNTLYSSCVTYRTPWETLAARNFPHNPYLGKQSIFLSVASILSMCLCPHSQFTYHQKVVLARPFYVLGSAIEHYINLLTVLNSLVNSLIC